MLWNRKKRAKPNASTKENSEAINPPMSQAKNSKSSQKGRRDRFAGKGRGVAGSGARRCRLTEA